MKQGAGTNRVGTGICTSPAQSAFYIILVALGFLGNAIVILVIGKSVFMDRGGGQNSDIIIVNMALSNLMVSLMRNILLIMSDLGFQVTSKQHLGFIQNIKYLVKVSKCYGWLQVYSGRTWCQFLMGVWVWLRSVNVWSTLFLSAFHLHTLKQVAPRIKSLQGPGGTVKALLLSLSLIWIINLFYAIPAHIFSINGNENTTEVRGCFTFYEL